MSHNVVVTSHGRAPSSADLAGVLRHREGLSPASTNLSFVRDITVISFGVVGFVVFGYFVIAAWSNAVNLTDGLDGLAAGSSLMVFAAYVVIGFWQFRNSCVLQPDLAIAGAWSPDGHVTSGSAPRDSSSSASRSALASSLV